MHYIETSSEYAEQAVTETLQEANRLVMHMKMAMETRQ